MIPRWKLKLWAGLAAVFLASDLVLSAALLLGAKNASQVQLVGEQGAQRWIKPNAPSDQLLRAWSARYVYTLECYTPATIEDSTRSLLACVSPEGYAGARRFLESRANGIRQGGISGSVILDDVTRAPVARVDDASWQVTLGGLRRTFMGSDLVSENRLSFRVTLEVGPPTDANPCALYVSGATVDR